MAQEGVVDAAVSVACAHCGKISHMDVYASCGEFNSPLIQAADGEYYSDPYPEGYMYELLKCPFCNRINLCRYEYWGYDLLQHGKLHEDDIHADHVYPVAPSILADLPPAIRHAWLQTLDAKSADGNAYPIAVRRVIDLVCIHKLAAGDSFRERLTALGNHRDFPSRLIPALTSMEPLINAVALELNEEDKAVAEEVCLALLNAFYRLPALARNAQLLWEEYR